LRERVTEASGEGEIHMGNILSNDPGVKGNAGGQIRANTSGGHDSVTEAVDDDDRDAGVSEVNLIGEISSKETNTTEARVNRGDLGSDGATTTMTSDGPAETAASEHSNVDPTKDGLHRQTGGVIEDNDVVASASYSGGVGSVGSGLDTILRDKDKATRSSGSSLRDGQVKASGGVKKTNTRSSLHADGDCGDGRA